MKKIILLLLIATLNQNCMSQVGEQSKIEETVKDFTKFVDSNNVEKTNQLLDANYRSVVNRLFGSDDVAVITKDAYLSFLKKGEIGGDTRESEILMVDINGNNALVKAKLVGKELTFVTYLSLIKSKENRWLIINDQPVITKN